MAGVILSFVACIVMACVLIQYCHVLDQSCSLLRDVNDQDSVQPRCNIAQGYPNQAVIDEERGIVKTQGRVDAYCTKAPFVFVFRVVCDVI